jgi:hypothetical protein
VNDELLREAHPHVQQEWARMNELLDSLAMGIRLSTEAFLDVEAGRQPDLRGRVPAPGAPYLEWEDYFVSQGALRVMVARAPGEPTLFDAATVAA